MTKRRDTIGRVIQDLAKRLCEVQVMIWERTGQPGPMPKTEDFLEVAFSWVMRARRAEMQ